MTRRPAFAVIRAAIGPAIALFVIAYFAGAAIVGPNGLLSLAGYRAQSAERRAQLVQLDRQRQQLLLHARLLRPGHVDPDFADETVRRQTGQVDPHDKIIPLD
jgi:cell division protein FtsB